MIKKLKPKSKFSRNVITLMSGTVIAQAIPIAISPILTRIYTPDDFGVFSLYMSISLIGSVIATGRYELAILLPKKDSEAANIVVLSIIISIFMSFISLLIVFILNEQITTLLGSKKVSDWLYLTPVAILLSGVYQSFNYWLTRKEQYKKIAINRVAQNSVTGVASIGLGLANFGSGGLILGGIVGQAISATLFSNIVWKNNKEKIKLIKILKIYALVNKYIKMPKYNLPNALIDGFRLAGINILIANFFSTSVLGQFSLAWRMSRAPMALIGGSLSQVLFQKTSTLKKSDLYSIIKKFILRSILIAAPLFLIIYIYSVDIFIIIFGENWKLAGEAASIMTPWLFMNFLTSPLSTIFITINKQEILLIFSIFFMISPLGIIYYFHELDFINTLEIVSFSMSTLLFLLICIVLFLTKKLEDIQIK